MYTKVEQEPGNRRSEGWKRVEKMRAGKTRETTEPGKTGQEKSRSKNQGM